jgi:hypothetical protein
MAKCRIESDGRDIFVVYGGKRIAKRGRPETPQARTWVSLVEGYTVTDEGDLEAIVVEYNGIRQGWEPSDN